MSAYLMSNIFYYYTKDCLLSQIVLVPFTFTASTPFDTPHLSKHFSPLQETVLSFPNLITSVFLCSLIHFCVANFSASWTSEAKC